MTQNTSILGRCPECEADVPEAWLLIQYEREDGTPGIWAECPACEEVVDPA